MTECAARSPAAEDAVASCCTSRGRARGRTGCRSRSRWCASTTEEADETFTDLITYTDTARILQVQRSEVGGEVTDLRDPGRPRHAAAGAARRRSSATGIAGPPGTSAPEGPGLVGLALDATC